MHKHNAHTESNSYCSLFLSVLRCFTSRGSLYTGVTPWVPVQAGGFPHSDISGSQATYRLPEAFRRLVTSFIAILGLGIHRALLTSLMRRPIYHNHYLHFDYPATFAARLSFTFATQPCWLTNKTGLFVCQMSRVPSKRKPPRFKTERFSSACAPGPYGLSTPSK